MEQLIVELRGVVARLEGVIATLNETLVARDERIAKLEELLEDSRRSGKRQAAPFSKGDPADEPKPPGRKSGQQHGRHGHRMAPTGSIDRELEAPLPPCCPHCGGDVVLERTATQFETELPESRPVVTRFNVGVGRCKNCRRRVQGRHPEQTSDALGAAGSGLGPQARSFAQFLHYGLGLSFGKSADLLGRLGIRVTAGALSSGAQSTGTALVPLHREIVAAVKRSAVVVPDETGWRVCGEGAWLWVVTTDGATAYNVAPGRGFDEARELLSEDFSGVIVRDGWAVYRRYAKATHQTCVGHLLRRCHEMTTDNPDWARATPRDVRDILIEALDARELGADERREIVADLTERIEILAEHPHPYEANRRLVNHLMNEREALFTFLTRDGVDATNYKAEQAIRPAVVNRKVWGGNRTWRGAATQSRIMSVLRTAAQRGIDPIEFLVRFARAPDPAAVSLFH
jgi:transposase